MAPTGVGLMFGRIDDKPVCGIDLDTWRDRDTKPLSPGRRP
jgi:hypothetical protein